MEEEGKSKAEEDFSDFFPKWICDEEDEAETAATEKPGLFAGGEDDGFYARFIRHPDSDCEIVFFDKACDRKLGRLDVFTFCLTLCDADTETLVRIVRFVDTLKEKDGKNEADAWTAKRAGS